MGKSNKSDKLTVIFHESVFNTIAEGFKENINWVMKRDGALYYIVILLNINAIGGVTGKKQKDAETGSFIEYVANNQIKSYVTEELLIDSETFVVIPDLSTIKAMREFKMLTGVSYQLCAVSTEGEIHRLDEILSFDKIKELVDQDLNINTVLKELVFLDEVDDLHDSPDNEPEESDDTPSEHVTLDEFELHDFELISAAAEEINSKLSYDSDAQTDYSEMFGYLQAQKSEGFLSITDKIDKRRSELVRAWDEKLERIGAKARLDAMDQYRERYISQHDNDLFNIQNEFEQEVELKYQKDFKDFNDSRRRQASELMEISISQVMQKLIESYKVKQQKERDLLNDASKSINACIDSNLKDEVARIQALERELLSRNEAEEVRAKYTARLEAASVEFRAKLDVFERENKKLKESIETEVLTRDLDYAAKMAIMIQDNDRLRNQVNELNIKIETEDSERVNDWETRVSAAEHETERWIAKYDASVGLQRKTIVMFACVMGFIAIIAIVVFGVMYMGDMSAVKPITG